MPAPVPPALARAVAAGQILAWAGATTAAAVLLLTIWPAPPIGLTAGPPALDDLLATVACTALLLVLLAAAASAWASLVLAAVRRAGSQRLVRLERVVAPGLVRRLAATAIGVGVLAGAGAAAATAAPVTVAVQPLVPSWPAETPGAGAPPTSPTTSTTPAPSASGPSEPGTPAGVSAVPQVRQPGAAPAHDVVVTPGDSLWRIAEQHLPPGSDAGRVAAEWPRWWSANRAVVGDDPDLIRPGQHLSAPVAGSLP